MTAASGLGGRLHARVWSKWRRYSVDRYGRRPVALPGSRAFVSFTFDDFPRTAWLRGGRILAQHGVRGTYFVSCGLLDGPSPSGPIVSADELPVLVSEGHELGCHTFEHLDGRVATRAEFERSIAANLAATRRYVAGMTLPVFAYPLEGPVLGIKRTVGAHFAACRGGGQTYNRGKIDLNLLKAYFFDWKTVNDFSAVDRLVTLNAKAGGWLIFATHDVSPEPSRYGCTPQYFERAVRLAIASGAQVLPMAQVLTRLGVDSCREPVPEDVVAS
jgi:peptidoglycan/xylan/chitin deacetylase (PgdA/CDA1 family)